MCTSRDRKEIFAPTKDDIKGANSITENLVVSNAKAESKTKSVSTYVDNVQECKYNKNGRLISTTYSWDNSGSHPTYEYRQKTNDGTWVGILTKYDYMVISQSKKSKSDGSYTIVSKFRGYYKGTVTLK